MSSRETPSNYKGATIHMTGIKGTGMAALAEILHRAGAHVTGSDVEERFFTDDLLEAIGITPLIGFDGAHVPPDASLLVYSAAYSDDNPERREARKRGIPQRSYTEMLGDISRTRTAVAVSGVHGKTTTTAMLGVMVDASAVPATVVVGSGVPGFGGSATLVKGEDVLIAETCEYRRHFLDYDPDILLVTSVEEDHLDYYRDFEDVISGFVEFGSKLPAGGTLVYCHDDPGATTVAAMLRETRPDLTIVPYGFTCQGIGSISGYRSSPGMQRFHLAVPAGRGTEAETPGTGFREISTEWELRVPGRHSVLNAAGAILVLALLTGEVGNDEPAAWRRGLSGFTGTRRRSEVIRDTGGILVLDDYAHHPTAIRTTLEGYRQFWPGRRLVVDFMSHTYTRTAALLDQFQRAFESADVVFLNDIYASARERYDGGITGETFAAAVAACHPDVRYVPDFDMATSEIIAELRPGDIFVTMGAGDNFRIAHAVANHLSRSE
ncbi:MAG: UDP-N-acetylmuramate--L-alanine ligase [Alkalispirochaeta sp.]